MADFTVNRSDGTILAVVVDGTVDSTSSSINLVGRNIIDYGETIAEAQIHTLENFSNTSSPSFPLSGQLWWDTTVDVLNVYDGSSFLPILRNIVEDLTPQLGGNLDANGKVVTASGDVVLSFSPSGGSGVNWIEIVGSETAQGPIIRSVGSDADIDLHITAKGAGIVNLGSGGIKLNADLDANGQAITDVGSPSNPNDVATKDYVDTEISGVASSPPTFRLDPAPVVAVSPIDEIIVLTSGGPGQSVSLPPAGAVPPGTTLTLKNGLGTSGSTIAPAGPDTIDGTPGPNSGPGGLLDLSLAFTRLVSDGATIWYII